MESTEKHSDACAVFPPSLSIHPVIQTEEMSANFSNVTGDFYSNACVVAHTGFFISTTLLLPLFALVIYMGHRQWREKSSVGRATTSHSDLFTYNILPMELFSILANGCNVYLMLNRQTTTLSKVSRALTFLSVSGQNAIHLATCVEHYVAVLHPVTYLQSKKPRNIRIRNISFLCFWVWLIGGSLSLETVDLRLDSSLIITLILFGLQISVIAFCSISILCSLTGPGPGDAHRGRMTVDLRKKRAFYTVTTIMGALLIRFFGIILQVVCILWMNNNCLFQILFMWFGLPSSLVQPLLFLHRAGKLPFCTTQRLGRSGGAKAT